MSVNDRMDITGARWRLDRAEAVLRLRALRASGDFEEYWQFHKLQEFQRNHVNKFQEPERLLAIWLHYFKRATPIRFAPKFGIGI